MPTTHVDPGCGPLLQDIANVLWKSRKVVVITGAGISTNSGIPDFRSENGLYSLIQAQFDAAQQQATESNSDADGPDTIEQRAAKRQRRAHVDSGPERAKAFEDPGVPFPGLRNVAVKAVGAETEQDTGFREVHPRVSESDGPLDTPQWRPGAKDKNSHLQQNTEPTETVHNSSLPPAAIRLPSPRMGSQTGAETVNSVSGPYPSSPPSFALGTPRRRPAHLVDTLPGSSSPLSSPPPITYDPYQESTSGSSSRDTDSSRSQSEEPSSATTPLLSSQTSFSSRTSLPMMKGRDLFDAQIWSCPIKTSVFYTFASTLREKVRSAEPTSSHRFVSILRDSRKLVRCYTQNIDQLEERVGLSTSLSLGAGSRYRFSARAGRNNGAAKGSSKGVDGVPEASQGESQREEEQEPSQSQQEPSNSQDDAPSSTPSASQPAAPTAPNRGVECVFLHGSLAELRCFVCARTASWEEETRLADTLAGRQPTCPHCAGATAAREEKGKRALGVGKLRPDIVLYGEEHPHAHLISPLVQHDLSLGPDMLLILGTSMRVHGLKVLVKEFAKAVHDRGGKVVFVNFTKPPESVWADIIDYWVQWDCDAWVGDLQTRKPALWLPPGASLPEEEKSKTARLSRRQSAAEPGKRKEGTDKTSKRKRESDGLASSQKEENGLLEQDGQGREQGYKQEMPPPPPKTVPKKAVKVPREPKLNPDAKRPASIRDHKQNGAYLVCRIMQDLRRITEGNPARSAVSSPTSTAPKPKGKRPRKSAPAALGIPGMETGHDAAMKARQSTTEPQPAALPSSPVSNALLDDDPTRNSNSSISAAVKSRRRKQAVAWRMIGGVETRVSLNEAGEPQTPTPSVRHTPAISRPSPVPDSRRLPPPTPTTPLDLPRHNIDQSQVPPPQPVATDPSASAIEMAINAGFRETDRLIAQMHHETILSRPATPLQLRLPPLLVTNLPDQQHHKQEHSRSDSRQQQRREQQRGPKAGRKHDNEQPQAKQQQQPPPPQQQREQQQGQQEQQYQYHTAKLVPLEPKVDSPGPRQEISSNVGSPVASPFGGRNPFFFSDPLVGWLGFPPVWLQRQQQQQQQQQRSQQLVGQEQHHQQGQGHGKEGGARGGGGRDGGREWVGGGLRGESQQQQQQKQQRDVGVMSPWCPDEQLRKEQEAALMLSAMRGTG